jgi:hypothetical protein
MRLTPEIRNLAMVICLISAASSNADPQQQKILSHPKSACVIEASAGEYPRYSVKRNGKLIYSPESDGISEAIFSPQGKKVAFVGSEVNGFDIPERDVFQLVILECSSGRLQGHSLPSTSGRASWISESVLEYIDGESTEKTRVNAIFR